MMKRQAKVVLQQESIDRLFTGKRVVIRLEDIELELTFDPSARTGRGSMEDIMNDIFRAEQRRRS
jgi:hypothetical protein